MTSAFPLQEARQHANEVAATIQSQIKLMTFATLGAHRRDCATYNDQPGLVFLASILPFTKAGTRATAPRQMSVRITLNPHDTYDITVTYTARREGRFTEITHYEATGIYGDMLNPLLTALDYDGDTVLNPRYL